MSKKKWFPKPLTAQYPLPGPCRKDPEANTKPPTQMPVEFARKPGPAAFAACYCYWKNTSHTAPKAASLSAHQTRSHQQTTRERCPHESTPQRVALPRCRPLGNQCVWIFCAHSIFPTEEARFKKSYRHKWLSRLKAWNTPNCSYLCILLLRIRHGANGQKPQETGAPQENKKHPCMFAPIFGADVDE